MIPDQYLEDLRQSLAARAESVCRELLPGGKRVAKRWSCGGIDGGPGKSMDVELDGDKVGVFHDRATGEAGDLLKLWQLNRGLSFIDAVAAAADFCRMAAPTEEERKIDPANFDFHYPAEPKSDDGLPAYKAPAPQATVIDWARCVAEFTPEKAAELCEWRGYSVEIVRWMKENELIGCFQGNFAFPVHNAKGQVAAIHHKSGDGWFYYPKGAETQPLIIGSPTHAAHTLAFESQWDAFAVLDKLHAYDPENGGIYAAYITRSATSNTDISKHAIVNLIAVNQNDPKEKKGKDGVIRQNTNKEGRTPSEEWLHRISSSRNKITQFAVFEPPSRFKDANDWIRDEQPDHFEVFKKVIENSKNPILKSTKSVGQLLNYVTKDDPNALIGHEKRFLSKGGSWMIIGPSGIGKSTLITSLCIHAAAGVTWHGLTFRRPLKTLVIQAENDDGDLAEMLSGGCSAVRRDFSETQFKAMGRNLLFEQVTDKIGEKFVRWLEEIIRESGAEIVVIDPLLSFIGDDISQQKVVSQFFCHWLQPVLHRTGVICILIHHTGKPPKEKVKNADLSYSGLGSSVLTSWPRAVSVLATTDVEGTFLFKNCKRGKRARMVDQFTGFPSVEIYLKHGSESEGLQWLQTKHEETADDGKPQWKGKASSKPAPAPVRMEVLVDLLGPLSTYRDLYDVMTKAGNLTGTAARGVIADILQAKLLIKGQDGLYRKPEGALL